MPFTPLRRAIALFVPAGLLTALFILLANHPAGANRLAALGDLYFYVALCFALLLGWRFDRSLLVFAGAIIALSGWLLSHYGGRGDALGRILPDVVALLLPLNLLLFTLLKERGILTRHGLLRWGILALQALVIWLLFHYHRYDWLGLFDLTLFHGMATEGVRLQQPALLAFTAALVVGAYRLRHHATPLHHALLWVLVLIFYALSQPFAPDLVTALFASALLLLIVAVLETSYSMAFRDELTGLHGRRALNQTLLKLGNRYTIAMLDVDHFKKFNDTYGHDIGDEVLQMVAAKIGQVGGGGKAYRYGGEEFTVLFPGKEIAQATPHLEGLREAIANSGFTVREKHRPGKKPQQARQGSDRQVTITVSIGVAQRNGEQRAPEAVIKAADQALYRAKKGGRNRVSQ